MNAELYADSAQARAGDVVPVNPHRPDDLFDWRAAADRREREAVAMRERVNAACDDLATRLQIR